MDWLTHLKSNSEAYDDFLRFLDNRRELAMSAVDSAKDMDAVNRIKGARAEIADIKRIITLEDREKVEHAGYIERTKGR